MPQPPQRAALLAKPASQPLLASWPQSPVPATHTAVVHARDWRVSPGVPAVPQAPQWLLSALASISQPLLATPSQSKRPATQA